MSNKMSKEELNALKEFISKIDKNNQVFKKTKEIIETKEELNKTEEIKKIKNN